MPSLTQPYAPIFVGCPHMRRGINAFLTNRPTN